MRNFIIAYINVFYSFMFSLNYQYEVLIDTVKKDKDGNPTIQRVRIVPENKDKY